MRENRSPWIYQLDKDRVIKKLDHDLITDIAIVGAGIAGISTAFFLLQNTDKNVVVIESSKLAHGATGHNAGQIVTYFERGFGSLVDEFGLELAMKAQISIESAWELLQLMYEESRLTIPFSRFLGHAGLKTKEQVLFHLRNNFYRKECGLPLEEFRISETIEFLNEIPEEYKELYTLVPHETIKDTLETNADSFVAVLSYHKGCVNSALFCQEVVKHLLKKYPERLSLYEETHVHKVVLHKSEAVLDTESHTITAEKVILCTNGFERFTILDHSGLGINTKFHEYLYADIGYMAAYLDTREKDPTAISFLPNSADTLDPYFYITRRSFEFEGEHKQLIAIGGPENKWDETANYIHTHEVEETPYEEIEEFKREVCDSLIEDSAQPTFKWHGLMGYTKNAVRMIGEDPVNPILLYNLGCNGIGILPSIYGGFRISQIIAGKEVERSIFDIPK